MIERREEIHMTILDFPVPILIRNDALELAFSNQREVPKGRKVA